MLYKKVQIKKMKIGVIGPIWQNIPPAGYGGTEEVVYNLVNGLSAKGHEVTLFGPKTAQVNARLAPTVFAPLIQQGIDWSNVCYTLLHIIEAFQQAEKFDILHMHLNKAQDYVSLPLSAMLSTPVLFTLHFKLPTPSYYKDRYEVLCRYKQLPYVSISDSQRRPLDMHYVRTVYNGLDLRQFPFSDKKGDYLVWLGKIKASKGTKEAILAARQTGIKLYVMGAVDKNVPEMLSYYEHEVLPLCDNKQVIMLGEVSQAEKARVLGGAMAFLNPIQWEEPFGLVMAEAQAVGTPVISFRRGSAPEIVIEGKTGFLVDSVEEMAAKIKEVERLNRRDCRKNVEERFTIEKMVEGYEKAYQQLRARDALSK